MATITSTSSVKPSELSHTPAITTINYGNKIYEVILMRDGIPLSVNFDSASLKKTQELIKGLLEAHTNNTPANKDLEPESIDAAGVHFANKTISSHDFVIADETLATGIATQISTAVRTFYPKTVRALDAWDALDNVVQQQTTVMPAPASPTQFSVQPPSAKITTDLDLTRTSSPEPVKQVKTAPAATLASSPNPIKQVLKAEKHISSIEIDLKNAGIDLNQPDWFENIRSPRLKRRILKNLLNFDIPGTGPARSLFNALKQKHGNHLFIEIRKELPKIEDECASIASDIPKAIREQAESLYELSFSYAVEQTAIQQAITALMGQTFDKEALSNRFIEQAQVDGMTIDPDRLVDHYKEDTRRFVQALIGWLDNN